MAKLNKKIFARKKFVDLLVDISKGLVPTGTTYELTINNSFRSVKEIRYTENEGIIFKIRSNSDAYEGNILRDYSLDILNSHVKIKHAGAFEIGDLVMTKKILIQHIPLVGLGSFFTVTGYSEDRRFIHCGQNSFDPREITLITPKMYVPEIDETEENFLN